MVTSGGGGSGGGKSSAKVVDNSAESDIIKDRKGLSFEEYIEDPSRLGESTHKEKYDCYTEHHFDVRALGNGAWKNVPYEDGGGYRVFFDDSLQKMLMYHPDDHSHHKGEYYKLSEGKYGSKRFRMDGTPVKE